MRALGGNSDADVMAEINITPFTDVLLVLLIIFMILAAIATPPGFQKSLAHGRSGHVTDAQPIRVLIDAQSHVYVDGALVPAGRVYAVMAETISRHGADTAHFSKHIELIGDTGASYDAIMKVLDAGREAGDDDVGLVVH